MSTQASLIGKATQKLLLICPQLRIVCLCTGLVRVLHPVTNPARVNGDRTHHLHWVPKSRWAPNLRSPRSQFPMKNKIKKKSSIHKTASGTHSQIHFLSVSLILPLFIYPWLHISLHSTRRGRRAPSSSSRRDRGTHFFN